MYRMVVIQLRDDTRMRGHATERQLGNISSPSSREHQEVNKCNPLGQKAYIFNQTSFFLHFYLEKHGGMFTFVPQYNT